MLAVNVNMRLGRHDRKNKSKVTNLHAYFFLVGNLAPNLIWVWVQTPKFGCPIVIYDPKGLFSPKSNLDTKPNLGAQTKLETQK